MHEMEMRVITIVDAGKDVLGYKVQGTIEKRDIERVVEDMDAKVPQSSKLRLYVELDDMSGISPQALWRDLQLGLPRTSYLTRIERVALVTDSEMVRSLVGLQSHLGLPVQIKVYAPASAPTAMQWLAAA
jgi:hypothetical protein